MKRKIKRIQQKKLKNKNFMNSIKAKTSLVLALSACLSLPCLASDNLPVPNSIDGASLNYLDKTGASINAGSYLDKANAAKQLNINVADVVSQINYDTYNIGTSNIVNYNFTSADQVSINLVTGSDPSRILGTMQSQLNGQLGRGGTIYLLNRNGILFGANSKVNVGALVASTMDMASAFDTDKGLLSRALEADPAGIYMEKGSNFTVQDDLVFIASAIKDEGSRIVAPDANVHFITADGVLFELDPNNPTKFTDVSSGAPIVVDADVSVDGNAVGKTGTIDLNPGYVKANNLNVISKLSYTGANNLVGAVNLSCIKKVGNDFSVDADGNLTVNGPVTADNNIDLKAKGQINTSSLKATAGDIELTSTGGSITVDGNLYAKTAGKNISLDANGDVTVNGTISAGQDVSINGNGVTVRYTKAGNDINVEGTSFNSIQERQDKSDIYHGLRAGNDIKVDTTNGKIEIGYVTAGQDINLSGGMISTGILKAGNDILVDGSEFTTKQERPGKSTLYHLLKAGNKVDIAVGNGAIDVGNISTGSDINLSGGSISTRELNSGGDIDITGSSLSTKQVKDNTSDLYHAIKADGDIDIDIKDSTTNAPGVIDIGFLSSGNDITLTGSSISTRPITAANDITVDGTSFTTKKADKTLYNPIKAGNDVDISVGNGSIVIGNISADNDIKLDGGAVSTRELNADNDVDISATSFNTERTLSSGKIVPQAVKGGKDVDIAIKTQLNGDSGEINVGYVRAGEDLNISSQADVNTGKLRTTTGNVDVFGKSVKSDDVITGGDVNFDATDNIELGNVFGNNIKVGSVNPPNNYPVDNITTKNIIAVGNIDLLADKSVTTGDLSSATGYINIERGLINTGNLTADKNISLTSTSDILTGNATAGTGIGMAASGNITTGNLTTRINDILLISGGNINTGDINSGNDVILAAIGGVTSGNILAQNGILIDAVSGGVSTGNLTANTEDITVYGNTFIRTQDLNAPKGAVFAIPRVNATLDTVTWGFGGIDPFIILLENSIDSRQYADMLNNAIRTQPGLTRGLIDGQIQFTSRYFIPLAAAAELEEEDLFVEEGEDQIDDNTGTEQ